MVAAVACAVALAATLPAQVAARWAGAPAPVSGLGGTLWTGRLQLAAGHALHWRTRPLASLAAAALVAELRLDGPGTALQGEVRLRPGGLRGGLAGTAGWGLVEAVGPGFPIRCDARATLRLDRIEIGRAGRAAAGRIVATSGRCARTDGSITDVPMPALVADVTTAAAGIALRLAAEADPAVPLAEVLLTADDRLQITVRQAGAALVPGMPADGDSVLDLPLAVLRR